MEKNTADTSTSAKPYMINCDEAAIRPFGIRPCSSLQPLPTAVRVAAAPTPAPTPSMDSPSATEHARAGNKHKHASVVLMCGVPASGKSAFASAMKRNINNTCVTCGIRYDPIVLIDYDEIANDIVRKSSSESAHTATFSETDLQAWRDSREAALSQLETELRNYFAETNDADDNNLLVILDDNFFLRSMRRDAYKVCQRVASGLSDVPDLSDTAATSNPNSNSSMSRCAFTIGFSVVLVDTPLDVCLKRNSLRKGKTRIPEETITRMTSTLERPDPSSGDYQKKFEVNSFTIEYPGNRNEEIDICADDIFALFADKVQACLEAARNNPVIPPHTEEKVDPEALQQAREQTKKSRIHQADCLLRNLVGAVGRADKSMGRSANNARKRVLQQVREDSIAADAGGDEKNIADAFKKCLESETVESDVLLAIDEACSIFSDT